MFVFVFISVIVWISLLKLMYKFNLVEGVTGFYNTLLSHWVLKPVMLTCVCNNK